MARQGFKSNQWSDANGAPAGGCTTGIGFTISWQNGPIGRHSDDCGKGEVPGCAPDCTRMEPNGAFVEDVIAAAIDRLEFYQGSRFASTYNAEAIKYLAAALDILDQRTRDRESRSVEGTHKE